MADCEQLVPIPHTRPATLSRLTVLSKTETQEQKRRFEITYTPLTKWWFCQRRPEKKLRLITVYQTQRRQPPSFLKQPQAKNDYRTREKASRRTGPVDNGLS
jgi:hypothetical protein